MDGEAVENVGENENETLLDRIKNLANNFVDGVLSIFELRVNRVEVSEELCVDGVCLNADDLRRLLDGSVGTENPPNENPAYEPPAPTPEPEPNLEPIIEEASAPEPSPDGV
jgi:hypothetical protein